MVCEHCGVITDDVRNRISDEMLCDACEQRRQVAIERERLEQHGAAGVHAIPDTQSEAMDDVNTTATGDVIDISDCCTADCQYNGRHDGRFTLVRCSWCMREFHRKCLKDYRDQIVYTCATCRRTPSQVAELTQTVNKMVKTVTNLSKINEKITKQLTETQTEYTKLVTVNSELRNAISNLTQQLSSQTWQNMHGAPNKGRTLVIGSSIIRDIDQEKLENIDVLSISGAKIKTIHDKVKTIKEKYNKTILVVGGNDCDTRTSDTDERQIDDILGDYRLLIEASKKVSSSVTVATVCPRLKDQETSERIDAFNAGLQVLCADAGCTLINNDETFKLSNNLPNDGYIIKHDKTHLTYSGTNRLAANLGLKAKPGFEQDICLRKSAKKQTQSKNTSNKSKHSFQTPRDHMPVNSQRQHHYNTTNAKRPPPRRHADRQQGPAAYHDHQDSHWQQRQYEDSDRDYDDDNSWQTMTHRSRRTARYNTTFGQSRNDYDNQRSCRFCGERNHSDDTCRHGDYIMCDVCRNPGHKSKHHKNF